MAVSVNMHRSVSIRLEQDLARVLHELLKSASWLRGWRVRAAKGPHRDWDLKASGPVTGGGRVTLCVECKGINFQPSQFSTIADRPCVATNGGGAVKVLAYALSGLFCALAGVCQAAQELQGDPEAGTAYELSAIAIVVIGGASLRGGRGGIGLTLLGILTIGYLEKILSINAVGEQSRLMLTGAIIIVAVLFQKRQS